MTISDMKLMNSIKAKLVVLGIDTRGVRIRVSGSTCLLNGKLEKLKQTDMSETKRKKMLRDVESAITSLREIKSVIFKLDN